MGWKGEGHGLGRMQQGITQPIEVDSNAYRFGLGCRIYDEFEEDDQDTAQPMDAQSAAAAAAAVETSNLAPNDNNNRSSATGGGNDDQDEEAMDCAVSQKQPKKRGPRRAKEPRQLKQQPKEPRPQRHWQTKSLMVNNIRTILANYAHSEAENDLVFEKSLTADDRKLIHQEAHKLGLKTRSQGVEPNRFLVVCKRRTGQEIFEAVLKNGGQSSKFQLISAPSPHQPPSKSD